MGYKVDMNEMYTVEQSCSAVSAQWSENAMQVFDAINGLNTYAGFQGASADSIKSYFMEVHGSILSALFEIFNTYRQTFFLYRDGYNKDIDSSIYAVLKEDELRKFKNTYIRLEQELSSRSRDLSNTIRSVDYIISLPVPSAASVLDNYRDLYTRAEKLDEKIRNYESEHREDTAIVDLLIRETTSLIERYNGANRHSAVSYHAGDITNSPDYLTFCTAVSLSQTYRTSVQSELSEALEREQVRVDQRNADLAEEREKKGVLKMIGGGVAIVVGVAAIVCTAGAATPLVVTAAVAGGCTIAYGASNMIEGGQDLYYGMNGDITTAAFNPIRDTVFQGNQELYDFWGQANMIVASACIPAGKVAGNLASQGVQMSGTASMKVLATHVGTRLAGKGIGAGAGEIAGMLGADETEKKVISTAASVASSILLDKTVGTHFDNQVEMEQISIHQYNKLPVDEKAEQIIRGVRNGSLSVKVPKGDGVLYSGKVRLPDGTELKVGKEIQNFAADQGLRTLESTEAGKMMDDLHLFDVLPEKEAHELWSQLSGQYADQLTGNVNFVAPNPELDSIFVTSETPAVLEGIDSGRVTDLTNLVDEFKEFLTK